MVTCTTKRCSAGFLLSASDINKIASAANIVSEDRNDMMYGMIDDYEARIDAFRATLEGNGMKTIVDEAQAQLDA